MLAVSATRFILALAAALLMSSVAVGAAVAPAHTNAGLLAGGAHA